MKPRHPIEMKIVLDTDGNLQVSCIQLNDLIFCLGLIENAKLALTGKKTATPSVIGVSPLSKKEKILSLDDTEGWEKLAQEDLAPI